MPTDANILLGLKPMQTTSPMAMYEAGERMETNRLANMMNNMKMDEYKQGVADKNALSGIYKQFTSNGAGNVDLLFKGGRGKEALELQKSQGEAAKTNAANEKDQLANMHSKLTLGAQLLSSAKDQTSYDASRAEAQANGLDVSRMPPQFDPNFVASKLQESQSIKEQLEQKWKAMAYSTPDANARLTAKTSTDNNTANNVQSGLNNAATVGASRDNAQLGDTRARDLNTIKQAEVTLKREAKDEAIKLTKDGQLASFETMLGTLERLGNHPGLSRSVGAAGVFPTMPGSNSANFQAELNTFQSQAFIPMVAQLKGMGALSDAEGKRLTQAVGALDPKMGEQAFRDSVKRITDDMTTAYKRMGGSTGGNTGGATGSWGDAPTQSALVSVKNAADYANIPSGTAYIDPNGKTRTKK